jgi:hypothetical protein
MDGSGTLAVMSSGIVLRRVLWLNKTASIKTFLESSMMYLLDLQTRLQSNIFNATSKVAIRGSHGDNGGEYGNDDNTGA